MKVGRYLIIFLLLMGLLIAFGNKGLLDNYKKRGKLVALRDANKEVINKNKELKEKIVLLRSNLQYIERVARNELGMVKNGEVVYRFQDHKPQ